PPLRARPPARRREPDALHGRVPVRLRRDRLELRRDLAVRRARPPPEPHEERLPPRDPGRLALTARVERRRRPLEVPPRLVQPALRARRPRAPRPRRAREPRLARREDAARERERREPGLARRRRRPRPLDLRPHLR